MLRYLPALGFVVLMLFGACATPQDGKQVAGEAVALAKVADAEALLKLFHYPPNMSEAERRKDAEGVSSDLAWLLAEFGNPTSVKVTTARVEFYELGLYGGTNAYWKSISPFSDIQFIYEARFSKL